MSLRVVIAALAFAVAALPSPARTAELTVGVFLPQAAFATNAERSAFAQGLADALGAATGGNHTFVPQLFARRADAISFVQARRVDLLVADGLLFTELSGEILAESVPRPAAALYATPGTTVAALARADLAMAEVSGEDLAFYAEAALAGEVAPRSYFGEVRPTKDAGAALGAVRAGAARAAFAPAGHPAASGLVALAEGGALPPVVFAVTHSERVDAATRAQILAALGAGAGAAVGPWRAGDSGAIARARALAHTPPRVLAASPRLAGSVDDRPRLPPLRLQATGRVRPPAGVPDATVAPTLPEEP